MGDECKNFARYVSECVCVLTCYHKDNDETQSDSERTERKQT